MNFIDLLKMNPETMYQNLMRTNPKFKDFVEKNQGKSPDQIASDYGVDLTAFKNLLNSHGN